MNIYKNYISPFLQGFNPSQLALFIAILSMAFVVASKDGSKCLSAQCVAGANEVMAGDITIKSTNPNGTTLKSTAISDIDINLPATTGTLLHTASSLGNNQILQTDSNGNISTGTIPALDIDDSTKVDTTGGTSGQILKVGATSGLEFANYEINETQFDSSNATTLGQFLRSNATNGLDFDTLELDDIGLTGSPSVGDSVRVNATGELEIYTPTGGGDITKVASGNMVVSTADSQMVIACWYGQHTLDPTKEYILHIDSGTVQDALTTGYNKFRMQKNDCTSGGGLEFDSVLASMWSVGGRMGNTTSNIVSASYCYGVGGGTSNSIYARASNIAGRFNFRPYKDDDGFNLDWTLTSVNYNNSNVPYGIQAGTGACISHYGNDPLNFNIITGMHMFLEGNADTTRTWALYETDI